MTYWTRQASDRLLKDDLGQADIAQAGKQLPEQGKKLKKKKPVLQMESPTVVGPNEIGDHALDY